MTPEELIPLLLLTRPPTSTSHTTSVAPTSTARSVTFPVVDEDLIADSDVMGEIAVCGGAGLCVAGNIAGGDGETLALHEVDPFVDERAQPDLGSLQIREDRFSRPRHRGRTGGPGPVGPGDRPGCHGSGSAGQPTFHYG